MTQNYSNHRRTVKGYHGLTLLLVLALFGGAISNLVNTSETNLYSATLILLISIILILIFYYTRAFALKAQDRGIRAEENLRYFILTGKRFDPELRLSQIIALRFASDEELPELARKAKDEKLTSNQIKKLIKNWRADYHRV